MSQKVKAKIVKDVTQLVLARRTKMCNFLEYKGTWLSVPRVMLDHCRRNGCFVFRFKGRLQAVCFPFLRVRDISWRQRTGDAGDRPSLRRSLGSVFRKRESLSPLLPVYNPNLKILL